jgi:hypothetical protein
MRLPRGLRDCVVVVDVRTGAHESSGWSGVGSDSRRFGPYGRVDGKGQMGLLQLKADMLSLGGRNGSS